MKAGSTEQLFLVHARDDRFGRERTGLTARDPGAMAAYAREGLEGATTIPLCPGRLGRWASGSFVEIDAALVPGVYQFGVPDEVMARGSPEAMVLLSFSGATIEPIHAALVEYDAQDPDHLGFGSLDPKFHIPFLRRGLPGLTSLELALWQQASALGSKRGPSQGRANRHRGMS